MQWAVRQAKMHKTHTYTHTHTHRRAHTGHEKDEVKEPDITPSLLSSIAEGDTSAHFNKTSEVCSLH